MEEPLVRATVTFSTSGQTPEQLAKAYGFNLDFLDRFRGYNDATENVCRKPGKMATKLVNKVTVAGYRLVRTALS